MNDLGSDDAVEAQKRRETYRVHLQEIDNFEEKVVDLLESGYDSVLDEGVGYNIAPLQKRGMRNPNHTSNQLDKFLNAEWGTRRDNQ